MDWDRKFPSNLHMDIEELTVETILKEFGRPDIIFMGFDCTTFSLAGISHHRKKNEKTGNLDAVSERANKCDRVNKHCLNLAKVLSPRIVIIENPRAGLRKMDYMQNFIISTTTYCQYGFSYMKPTDFFSNIVLPLKPPCKNGSPCHERAPRGSRSGLQGIKGKDRRSIYPEELCRHIVEICERKIKEEQESEHEKESKYVNSSEYDR